MLLGGVGGPVGLLMRPMKLVVLGLAFDVLYRNSLEVVVEFGLRVRVVVIVSSRVTELGCPEVTV